MKTSAWFPITNFPQTSGWYQVYYHQVGPKLVAWRYYNRRTHTWHVPKGKHDKIEDVAAAKLKPDLEYISLFGVNPANHWRGVIEEKGANK